MGRDLVFELVLGLQRHLRRHRLRGLHAHRTGRELDADRLEHEVTAMHAEPGRLQEMAAAMRAGATVDAAEQAAAVVEGVARG